MRTLMKVIMPVEPANRAVQEGTLPETIETLLSTLRPEASYFYTENGRRTALFVFDLREPAAIPAIAEPLFRELHAEVTLTPVMTADELQHGLEKVGHRREHAAPSHHR